MNVLDMLNSPWAIQPETLTEMCAIYAAHRSGETTDIKAAFGRSGNNDPKPYTVQDGVAIVPVEGVLSKRMSLFQQICGGQSYQSIQQDLSVALADPDVSSIILSIDSPGGAVDGVQGAADAIYAARAQKPIVAYVDGKAASAAYWLGSSASKLYIGSDTDQVGSIGVITQHIDTSNAEHQRGVKITDIAAGRYKAVGSQHAPLSAQDRNAIQDHLDQVYSVFVNEVARNRGVKPDTVLSKMADGRVFIGKQAIDAGLADGKITLPQLIQRMKSQKSSTGTSKLSQPTATKGLKTNMHATVSSIAHPHASAGSGSRAAAAADDAPVTVSTPAPPAARSDAEQRVDKLRALKVEEASIRRLMGEAKAAEKAACRELGQAIRASANKEKLAGLIAAKVRAVDTVRSLAARLRANDQAQLQALRG